jgi:hypothetical protein
MGAIQVRLTAQETALIQAALFKQLRQSPEDGPAIDRIFEKLRMRDWPYEHSSCGSLDLRVRIEQIENK